MGWISGQNAAQLVSSLEVVCLTHTCELQELGRRPSSFGGCYRDDPAVKVLDAQVRPGAEGFPVSRSALRQSKEGQLVSDL